MTGFTKFDKAVMTINWFPGHMYKAQKDIRALLPEVDLVIEVLDARLPYSSQNPLLAKIRGHKPTIQLLNKADLADPVVTKQWLQAFEEVNQAKAYAVSQSDPAVMKQIPDWCRAMFPEREVNKKPIQVLIMGVPNAGKSTVINIIAERTIATTGDEAAVTKRQQRIKLEKNVILHDTPGVLWQRFDNQYSAHRLAIAGSIKSSVVDMGDIAHFLTAFLAEHYPESVNERFQVTVDKSFSSDDGMSVYGLMEEMAKARHFIKAGNQADMERFYRQLITEFRQGQLGRITLETPEMQTQEVAEVAQLLADKVAKKAARKSEFKSKSKKGR